MLCFDSRQEEVIILVTTAFRGMFVLIYLLSGAFSLGKAAGA